MSDFGVRALERKYRTTGLPEDLYQLNAGLVRHHLISLPLSHQEIRDLEREQGWAALPIYRTALETYCQDVQGPAPSPYDRVIDETDQLNRNRRNAVYSLVGCIGRWGNLTEDAPLLEQIRDYIDEHNVWTDREGMTRPHTTHSVSRKIADVLVWLDIVGRYGFNTGTSPWDVITVSPLIDDIVISENAWGQSNYYSSHQLGRWRQQPGTPYYGGIHRDIPVFGIGWRTSVPGYGDAQSTVDAAARSVLYSIFRAKYQGRIKGSRDPIPRHQWPETVVFCVTQDAVDELQQLSIYSLQSHGQIWFQEPWIYNFLFVFPDER